MRRAALLPAFVLALALWLSACGTDSSDSSTTGAFDLTDIDNYDASASSGFWDPVNGLIGVTRLTDGTGAAIDFGDGSDGHFVNGPSQTGITVSGTTITFNTTTKQRYQFKSFRLDSGYTIQVTGTNHLLIQSLGETAIEGTIDLDGAAGSHASAGSTAGTGTGGAGDGGAGGPDGVTGGSDGTPGAGTSRGGSGGGSGNFVWSGGGGGCNGLNPGTNAQAGGGGAIAGACGADRGTGIADVLPDAIATAIPGGGGGGGGGGYDAVGVDPPGGGGGAGGGTIRVISVGPVSMGVAGQILSRGGAGGDGDVLDATDCGGGGGGGAGGTVWIQTASTFDGRVNVSGGSGGALAGGCTSGTQGGNGSRGVVRIDTEDGTVNVGNVTLTPAQGALTAGRDGSAAVSIAPAMAGAHTIYTRPVDLESLAGYFTVSSATEATGCGGDGTAAVAYQGSDDGTSYTTDVIAANISTLKDYRYLRAKVTINSTGANPPCVTKIQLGFEPKELTNLELSGGLACGRWERTQSSTPSSSSSPFGAFLVMWIWVLAWRFVRRRA